MLRVLTALVSAAILGCALLLTSTLASADAPVTIAVIDTGLDIKDARFTEHLCASGHRDFTGTGLQDLSGHGTHVTGLIQQYAANADYCLVIIKYWLPGIEGGTSARLLRDALAYAVSLNVAIINVSSSGFAPSKREHEILANHPHTLLIGAAGNNSMDRNMYPCGYGLANTVCVGALRLNGGRLKMSNYGRWVTQWEVGESVPSAQVGAGIAVKSGSSMATAIYTGKLINKIYGHASSQTQCK